MNKAAKQTTSTLLMIRPENFGFNDETSQSNAFQNKVNKISHSDIQTKALKEFDDFVSMLKDCHINVEVFADTEKPIKPDAIFNNNWFSTHSDKTIFTFPLYAKNRRFERRDDIVKSLMDKYNFIKHQRLEHFEDEGKFLESTGSLILDRVHKIAYVSKSIRSDLEVLNVFCSRAGYTPIFFEAKDKHGLDIYHTNVLMNVGHDFVVYCDEVVSKQENKVLQKKFNETQKEIITISEKQMNEFAGNMLEVHNSEGDYFLIMSKRAYDSLTSEQKEKLEKYASLIYSDLSTIENVGGGSARCMLGEIF